MKFTDSQRRLDAPAFPSPATSQKVMGEAPKGNYKQFLSIARGSNPEVQTQLLIAKELEFAHARSIEDVESLTIEIDKILNAILKKL